jgi:Putative transposase/Transposase zinc-binding domain
MIRLASVIQRFESAFLDQYRERLRPEHIRALAAIKLCRSQASPKMLVTCDECSHQTLVPHSCGHRHCPHCQHYESQQWIDRQLARLVPAEYFLITFTLPAELRPLARAHPRSVYDLILRCAWDTVRSFSHNDPKLRGVPGAIAVLHTNTRTQDFHPHAHLVVPAAALDPERRQWRTKVRASSKRAYLFNHKALAKVFRAKMLAALADAGLSLPERYPQQWVVDCTCVGSGRPALVYLGRYLYRGVIREQDILAYDQNDVCFRYRDAKTGQSQTRTVDGAHFLWLIVQHVLPKRFRRARNFGFLHPNCKRLIALLQLLLRIDPGPPTARPRAAIRCACCRAAMTIVRTRIRPSSSVPWDVTIPSGGLA